MVTHHCANPSLNTTVCVRLVIPLLGIGDPRGAQQGTSEEGKTEKEEEEGAGVWSKSAQDLVEKSREEEYDDYFKDMLL